MTIFPKFAIPIYVGRVRSNELLSYMSDVIESKRSEDNLESPWGDDISTSFKYLSNEKINSFKEHSGIIDEMKYHCNEFVKQLSNDSNDFDIKIIETWYNISNKGQYQNWHTHPKFDISGCIYTKTNGASPIEFQSPSSVWNHSLFPREYIPQENSYIPTNGDIVMFPSFLPHRVHINEGEGERISITFNANIKHD
jgi:uncharacterized protein (TIGR02466 family)